MTWHAVVAFLACARIGAIHSVVFAGFSAGSLRDRIQDCESRVLITSDEGRRGGKTIATKVIVDAALNECPLVEHVLVLKRTGNTIPWSSPRDKWWHQETANVPNYCPLEIMASEDPLFILYVCPPLVVASPLFLISLLDLGVNRKTKGSCSFYCRLPCRRCHHPQIRL